ncbi:hypothetical protein [Hydrogenimonas sp.]
MRQNKNVESLDRDVDEAKREFMVKYGKIAATAPLGLYLLMGPGASKAQASGSCGHHGGHHGGGHHGGGHHGGGHHGGHHRP